MYSVFDLYNGGPKRDWSAELRTLFQGRANATRATAAAGPHTVTQPTLPLDRYVGTYVDSTYGEVQVTLSEGALQAQIVDQAVTRLEPWEYDTFRARGDAGSRT